MTKKFFHNLDNYQEKPTVLIAGGAGFVGSYLCELLLEQNCRVICLDNLITGSKKNLENCFGNPNFLFSEQDLNKPFNQEVGQPDYIFHLAGLEAYLSRENLSLDALLTNASGTLNLLRLAEKVGSKFLLGSSQRVFEARISTQKLIDYFGKSEEAIIASLSEAKRYAEALTTEFTEKKRIDARIVRLDWVYGPRMALNTGGILSRIIKQGIEGGPIKIPGDGSRKIRPTFIGDVVYGLSKAMFSSGTSGKIYSLVNPKEETLLSVVYQLQGLIGQELKIEYVADEEIIDVTSEKDLLAQRDLDWKPKVGINDGLEQTVEYFQKRIKKPAQIKLAEEEKQPIKEKKIKKKSWLQQKGLVIGLLILVLFFLSYLPGSILINSLLGIKNLHLAYKAAASGNFVKTVSSAKAAEKEFTLAHESLKTLGPIFSLPVFDDLQSKAETYLTIGIQAGGGLEKLGLSAKNMVEISQAIFQGQTVDINQLSSEISNSLDSVYQQFSYLEAQIKSKPETQQTLEKFDGDLVEKLSTTREMILKAKRGSLFLPDLVGLYGRRTYLILFQNNMELRPTGGFIGSFALTTFENGRLIDFQVSDVYSVDGQLKGHVEPPEAIRRYLGEAGWYLRDSNFSPDFPTSAARAAWFLDKGIGRKVDGILAIDLYLAQRILKALGPIKLIDYQEEINADNLFERAEYYAEVNFFPGSTQKKDFLGSLANALFEETKGAEEKKWLGLGRAIYQSLKSKDLLIYLNNQEVAKILTDLGWDGGVRNVKCAVVEKCLIDYLMVVESNLGVNKANYFVKRNLTHQVSFEPDGKVKENLRIEYHNQSQSEIFPAGRYKNYLRILVPEGTTLQKVTVDGKEIDEDKIDEEEINGKIAFGFLVEVPIESKKVVEINYQLANRLSLEEGSHYLLYLQKQPGIEDDVFNFWFIPPVKAKVVSAKPQANMASGLLVFTPKLDQDLVFEVAF